MLIKIFVVLAPALAALVSALSGFSVLSFILLTLGFFAGFCVLFLALLAVSSRLAVIEEKQTEMSPYYRFLLLEAVEIILFFCGVRVKAEGLEKIPTDRRFLLVGNHRSNLDPIVALHALKKHKLAFVSKPENFNIPFIGNIMRKCCFLPIDREDDRKAVYTIMEAIDLIKTDACSVGIYPEGTRNRESLNLLPFKAGSLKISQRTGAPIVVAAADGTEKVARRLFTTVRFTVCGVIEPSEMPRVTTQELSRQAQQMLCECLNIEYTGQEESGK